MSEITERALACIDYVIEREIPIAMQKIGNKGTLGCLIQAIAEKKQP